MKLLEQICMLDYSGTLPSSFLEVRQDFDAPRIRDISRRVQSALQEGKILNQMRKGDSVAVALGSRGIANIAEIAKSTIDCLRLAGLKPFVVPAMGSHGGARANGQKEVLSHLGITTQTVGAEIRASMEVKEIGKIDGGPSLFQGAASAEADHTLLVNRIKPHTAFRGKLESGLAKMEVIGLGCQRGASLMHNLGIPAFQKFLGPSARIYEKNSNVVGGVAILENAYEETAQISGLSKTEIGTTKESDLLRKAAKLMPSLPFPEIEVLGVRQVGKNISGTGMDPNIIGRLMIPRQPEEFGGPDIAIITVFDLTKATGGNANGIGLANVVTSRVVNKIDWKATYTNALTAGILGMQRSSLPLTAPDDRSALQISIRNCGHSPEEARVVLVQDTLTLDRLWVSETLRTLVDEHPRLKIVRKIPLSFSSNGSLYSPWDLR
ncbi:MAG: hypothetical protein DF168_01470 [Candidatus Moanabacter tarae]|uniref:LarA-like N-terminal domain-containing protein n=1 Tax=Candidatus Moanibacter tarae TaxID=2200854 RepID=A0A2Z4AFH0_9BACT|nr:MAG: hypothetical protein DF168_01470 [Candidatus Moanabacter tarae]|tara:strand:+ start:5629 stop:6939 length:1311 start_codon:yes stop_codon:yes gene_type:complete